MYLLYSVCVHVCTYIGVCNVPVVTCTWVCVLQIKGILKNCTHIEEWIEGQAIRHHQQHQRHEERSDSEELEESSGEEDRRQQRRKWPTRRRRMV